MTKRVRVENADSAPYKVIVEVWEGQGLTATKLFEQQLLYPCDITTSDIYVTSTRYLVVREG